MPKVNAEVVERQYGTRPEHSPKAADGRIIEPGTLPPDEDGEKHDEGGTYGTGVDTEFDKAEVLIRKAEATILTQQSNSQRHGIVEQRKGVSHMDEDGQVMNPTEIWRCQCGVRFQGRDISATEQLALAHLRRFDPDVPRK